MSALWDALINEADPRHAEALYTRAAILDHTFQREHGNPNSRTIEFANGIPFSNDQAMMAAIFFGIWCEPRDCGDALDRFISGMLDDRAEQEREPLPPLGPTHLLCDGRPVTIAPDGWWQDGNAYGVDYTVDATGETKWTYWPSPRFTGFNTESIHG